MFEELKNKDILNCMLCKKTIKNEERIVSMDSGYLNVDIYDGIIIPLTQMGETNGLWHEECWHLDSFDNLKERIKEPTK